MYSRKHPTDVDGLAANNMTVLSFTDRAELLYGPDPDITRDNSLCYGRPEGDVDGLAANNMTVLSFTDGAELLYGPSRI